MRTIRNCSVAVVGGAGFLGSHLVDHLVEDRNCKVLVVDNLVAGRREFIHPKAIFEHADITESEEYLRQLFLKHQVEYVFNYAAYPYIPVSFIRPIHVFNVNAIGALKVINAAQESGAKGILQVSSAEIYGDGESGSGITGDSWAGKAEDGTICGFGKLSEYSDVRPHSSYGVAKAAIDAEVQVRWREAKTPVMALRQFNAVGERETHPYIIPEIISQINSLRLKPIVETAGEDYIHTVSLGANSFRDFIYAKDAVQISVLLLEQGEFGEVYNLGSESGIKMYDLAKLIGKLMGVGVKVHHDSTRDRPWEIWHLQSNNTKIRMAANYFQEQLVPLEEALRRTIRYYIGNGRRWVWEK